jgi:hypothetical protein
MLSPPPPGEGSTSHEEDDLTAIEPGADQAATGQETRRTRKRKKRHGGEETPASAPHETLESPGRLPWAIVSLILTSTLESAITCFDVLLEREGIGPLELGRLVQMRRVASAVELVIMALAGICFLRWLRAACRDVVRIRPGVRPRFNPSSATAAFLVPFLNLFRPLSLMRAVREETDPDWLDEAPLLVRNERAGYREAASVLTAPVPTPPVLVEAWFFTWTAMTLVPLAGKLGGSIATRQLTLIQVPLRSVAALLATGMVFSLAERLAEQHRRALSAWEGEARPFRSAPPGMAWTPLVWLSAGAAAALTLVLAFHSSEPARKVIAIGLAAALVVAGNRVLSIVRRARSAFFVLATAMALSLFAMSTALYVSVEDFASRDAAAKALVPLLTDMNVLVDAIDDSPAEELSSIETKLGGLAQQIERGADHAPSFLGESARCVGRHLASLGTTEVEVARTMGEAESPLDLDRVIPAVEIDARLSRVTAYREAHRGRRDYLEAQAGKLRSCHAAAGIERGSLDATVNRWTVAVSADVRALFAARLDWSDAALASLTLLREQHGSWRVVLGSVIFQDPAAGRAWAELQDSMLDSARKDHAASARVSPSSPEPQTRETNSLAVARASFETSFALDGEDEPAPPAPKGLTRVGYATKLGPMVAYLGVPADHRGILPAVIWVPDGPGIDLPELELVAELSKTGVVVMFPTLRGQGKNPGRMDIGYGEVDDVLSARAHLARLSYVDEGAIHIVGTGLGGTRALLASALSSDHGSVVAVEAPLDMMGLGELIGLSGREAELRSPSRFTRDLKRPVYIVSSDLDLLVAADRLAEDVAEAKGKMTVLACKYDKACDGSLLLALLRAKLLAPAPVVERDLELTQADIATNSTAAVVRE